MSRKRQKEIAIGAGASRAQNLMEKNSSRQLAKKGDFLIRQFGNPCGRLIDTHGRSTRLALSAKEWGETVPKNASGARKLAKKGEAIHARLRIETVKAKVG